MAIVKSGQLGSERSAGETRTKRSFNLASHGAARNGWGKPQLLLAKAAAGWARIAFRLWPSVPFENPHLGIPLRDKLKQGKLSTWQSQAT